MKTIEEAAKEYAGISEYKHTNISHTYNKYDIAEAFERGVEFAQRWIPVEEELPEKDSDYPGCSVEVLLKISDGKVKFGYYYFNQKRWCFDYLDIENITHWRPIEIK